MANIVFNVAKGLVGHYANLPLTNDALILVPIETSGIVGDSTMVDYDTLADLLAGASNEQTTMGRKTLASVTSAVDDANDRRNMDAADVTWTGATGNPISAAVICYVPDNTAPNDATTIPLTKHDVVMTPDGTDFTLTISDFARAS
ncbi:hypothetical protein GCM10010372_30580 [Streptomyces tauricus]|uniref:hypothetical protein n=1 Tax=Streptomyces tauricus TaxID=68274 RepID=UPI001672086D|nr:hypothetical protein [Streptomyces tauricus]GHA28671.1 hypothetical protein GCM10010372_30580 [Streptomyces tauricus]